MKKNSILSIFLGLSLLSTAVNAIEKNDVEWSSYQFVIHNPLTVKRDDLICIKQSDVAFEVNNRNAYVASINGQLIDSQISRCFSDNDDLGLAILYPLNALESQAVKVSVKEGTKVMSASAPKTNAELQVRVGGKWQDDKLIDGGYVSVNNYSVPQDHKIGNKLFKYEGVGWESEQVAYRYYFDERGAIDIFGKQKNGLVLADIGIDGDDYHVLDDWGMDILKVGPSLGLGGIAAWHENKIFGANNFSDLSVNITAGQLVSKLHFTYQNWQVGDNAKGELQLSLSIEANSLLTRVKAETSSDIKQFATGIVKHDVEKIHHVTKNGAWSYLATWGNQSLNNDDLGMAIIFKTSQLAQLTDDKYNEIAVFNPAKAPVYYYLSAHWARTVNGPKSKSEYVEQLEQTLARLNHPVLIKKK